MAGVEHAESTAALWVSVVDILEQFAPASPAVIAIADEVDQYVVGVADFRHVAEQYQPRTMTECREIGKDILEPLPPNPIVPPTATTGG